LVSVHWITKNGVQERTVDDLQELVAQDRIEVPLNGAGDGLAWVDMPSCDEDGQRILREVFGAHPMEIRDCVERSMVPKVHAYPGHLFVVIHGVEPGEAGNVHLLELDMLAGIRYLVTVHGPYGAGVDPEAGLRETKSILERIRAGRLLPTTTAELSLPIVSGIARRMESLVAEKALRVATIDRQIMSGKMKESDKLVEEIFCIRHELLTVGTLAAANRDVYGRITALSRYLPPDSRPLMEDMADQFERIQHLCEREKGFLQGIADYHDSKVTGSMNTAMERLALLVAIVTPINALAAIYGMNVIVNDETNEIQLVITLVFMALLTAAMLIWTKRQGWW
jgi:Mg2+ and Co2+ transporter CorA